MLNLRRDRVALALVFVLPIVFFSIFATVFGGQGDAATSRIRVAVVDEDRSELSARLVEALRKETGLRVRTAADERARAPRSIAPPRRRSCATATCRWPW